MPIPGTPGGGGTGTADDITTSTLTLAGFNNQIITGVTLNLSLTDLPAGGISGITLTAPDGQTATIHGGRH